MRFLPPNYTMWLAVCGAFMFLGLPLNGISDWFLSGYTDDYVFILRPLLLGLILYIFISTKILKSKRNYFLKLFRWYGMPVCLGLALGSTLYALDAQSGYSAKYYIMVFLISLFAVCVTSWIGYVRVKKQIGEPLFAEMVKKDDDSSEN